MPPTHLSPRIPPETIQQNHARNAREFTTLPSTYSYTPNLPAGTIVGIVLGSVLGFLLLLYLIYLALTSGRKFSPSTTNGDGTILSGSTTSSPSSHSEIIVEENLSSTRSPRSHRSRRSRRPGGGGRTRRREEIIEEGYLPPHGRLHPPHSKHHQRNRQHPPEMVEASVVSSERSDVVTVMEEHSSVEGPRKPRRPGKGGYRAVDLDAVEGLSVDGSLRS
ncbi:uncharacterized protein BO72DRAFT_451912 [Aspergillus fijiensis CBS 313.89]|uniref:Uncharacterized protein n=1 Tax=Aspergillus fijiensis CBS 313.89 TaxID=1448319 RepID=A0A8G1RIC2_9EURO|nr:uncharacterized protein BO72DRAFT_451912 [Aspergillus fijiensis CBS 313.89]RAK73228.1 hypothetical protein BO72DRAFT_451912 [Aspergillus fijiensis CBS 313.89]